MQPHRPKLHDADLIVTADDAFGDPFKPDGHCTIIKRAAGFTLWARRRVALDLIPDNPIIASINKRRGRAP